MDEITEITQIVRLEFEGVQLAMKVGSASLKSMQKIAKFLYGLLTMEKTKGKTNLKAMMMKGGDMQVFQFEEKDLKKVQKLCKKFGILYTMVPKTDKEATTREILFHSEATPRVNLMLKKLNNSQNAIVKSMDSFVEGMSDEQVKVYENALQGKPMEQEEEQKQEQEQVHDQQQAKSEKKTDIPPERQEQLEQVKNRIQRVNEQNRETTHSIYIPKRMILSEDETQIRVRMPGTTSDEPKYVSIDKRDLIPGSEKRGFLSSIEKSAHYQLYDKDGREIGTVRGDDLYQHHFNRIGRAGKAAQENRIKPPKKTRQKVR